MANYATDFNYLIEGHDLNGEWYLTEGTLWRPAVSTRRSSMELPGIHGVVAIGRSVFEAPSLLLKHTVIGATPAAAEEAHQALIGVLSTKSSPRTDKVKITRVAGGYETEAYGRLIAISSQDEFAPNGSITTRAKSYSTGWMISFSSEFEITSVFFRDVDFVPPWNETFSSATSQSIYWAGGDDSSAPITDAVFRFAGPLDYVTVTDPVSGTGFSVKRGIISGEYLYVDTGNWDAWVSESADAWTISGIVINGFLDSNANGMLQMTPGIGASPYARTITLDYLIAGHQTNTTKVAIRAKRAYL